MKLIELGKKEWQVLAICDDNEDCQVIDHIQTNMRQNRLWRKMRDRLTLVTPEKGSQLGTNSRKAEHYRGGIGAFKENRSKGPKARVYFFRDGNRLICTEAFDKRSENIDPFIDRALEVKRQYLAAKQQADIEIDRYPRPEE